MIRHLRTATLLVAFSLFASAATASADCAWVLWWRHFPAEWRTEGGFRTHERCMDSLGNRVKAAFGDSTQYDVRRSSDSMLYVFDKTSAEGQKVVDAFQCLPDTVDPRWPKGK